MAKDYFQFKLFTVYQSRCAMKVGTDGTLLGAWAKGGTHILDIGTGTGLIALMMAQRFPHAAITAIDIDEQACQQAQENVDKSPFHSITVSHQNVTEQDGQFEAIVSNPPYFNRSLKCPDERKSMARHTSSLNYHTLMTNVCRLLSDDGEFSVIIPTECKTELEQEAYLQGLFKSREWAIKTTPRKVPKRYLLAFRKHLLEPMEKGDGVIETEPNVRSQWYKQLTNDFYL